MQPRNTPFVVIAFAASALLSAPFVEVGLATMGVQWTLKWVERVSGGVMSGSVMSGGVMSGGVVPRRAPISTKEAKRIIDTVYRCPPLRWLRAPHGQCLPKAMLQYGLQRHRGDDVRFVIGVRRPSDAMIDAHAWVEATATPSDDNGFEPILSRRGAIQ